MKSRNDDFIKRKEHLTKLSKEELKCYFFELTDKILDPLLDLAYEYTTPAIERSVLMRMGFSSLEAKGITEKIFEHNLLQHGAGHLVYIYAKDKKMSIRDAGLSILETDAILYLLEVFN
ncbi:MAG TPA: ornithine aminomutase [Acholeplasmataceae bacterium]|nr:ornithine aminomutase [Acholeplasmataceae bacterium]